MYNESHHRLAVTAAAGRAALTSAGVCAIYNPWRAGHPTLGHRESDHAAEFHREIEDRLRLGWDIFVAMSRDGANRLFFQLVCAKVWQETGLFPLHRQPAGSQHRISRRVRPVHSETVHLTRSPDRMNNCSFRRVVL
ncbi:hypothetical protein J6590_055004 [Homalodisca vitripennis]|nr:hypothetical protein J6590_055004 [Homalodisca vitripennis]